MPGTLIIQTYSTKAPAPVHRHEQEIPGDADLLTVRFHQAAGTKTRLRGTTRLVGWTRQIWPWRRRSMAPGTGKAVNEKLTPRRRKGARHAR